MTMNDELLKPTGTRIDPITKVRTPVYTPPANQVPSSVVMAGGGSMPAQVTNEMRVAPPRASPIREAISQRASVAPQVAQRLAQSPAARPIDVPRTLADVRGAAPATNLPFPNQIGQGIAPIKAPPMGSVPTPGNIPMPSAAPMAAAGEGVISRAAKVAAEKGGSVLGGVKPAIQRAASSPAAQIMGGVGKMAGGIAAGGTGLMAIDNVANGNKMLGAAQGALAATAFLPGPLGTAGQAANLGYQTIVNSKTLSDLIKKGYNFATGKKEPEGPGATVMPEVPEVRPDQRSQAPVATVAPAAAAAGGVSPATPVAEAATSPNKPRGPIAKAADRVVRDASAAPMSKTAQDRVGELQQMAGAEQEAQLGVPRTGESTAVQAFGPGDQYAGSRQTGPGVYELPAFDNGANPMPPGDVAILRGNMGAKQRGSIETRFDGARGEERANMPELKGYEPGQLFEFMRQAQGSNDPRVIEAGKVAAELLGAQRKIDADVAMQDSRNEALIKQQQIQSGATVQSAGISAEASKHNANAAGRALKAVEVEVPIIGADGKAAIDPATNAPIMRKSAVWFNPATSQWTPVDAPVPEPAPPPRVINKQQQQRLVQELRANKMNDDAISQFMKSNNIVTSGN